jgi:hypothetical protein
MSVEMNTTQPESTLMKYNAITYHRVHNLADMLPKPLPGPRLHELCQIVL